MSYAEPIRIERRAADHYRLSWPPELNTLIADISASLAPAAAAVAAQIDIDAEGADIRQLPSAPRHFFQVALRDGRRLLVAERRLALQESPNFRDFGGYATASGKRIRWGQLFRSGQLDRVDAADQQQIAQLDIRLVCDFRRDTEREFAPNRFAAGHAPRIENLAIAPGSSASLFEQNSTEAGAAVDQYGVQLMIAINRDLALEQTPAYTRMFRALVESDGPVLIHCAVGKDRTGFGAALIQAALGVPEPALLYDYLLTDRYLPIELEMLRLQEKYQWSGPFDHMRPILQVRREYFYAAFDAVKEAYGSIDVYLRDALAVDAQMLNELRARWLE
ncbi:MAG TPA: tyrosine-protein phosphatase [Spongiibacteraceae bacterium]|nr:tyrosine-protein phosphatase [Spongiibacteraceae bacterium]